MKMNPQNPGGEDMSERRMKGCEKYMRKGKGEITPYPVPSPMKKEDLAGEGAIARSKGAHIQSTSHAHSSMSGATVTGSGKGLK